MTNNCSRIFEAHYRIEEAERAADLSKRQFSENMRQYYENEDGSLVDSASKRIKDRGILLRRTKAMLIPEDNSGQH